MTFKEKRAFFWKRFVFWKPFRYQSLTVKLVFAVGAVVFLIVGMGAIALMDITRKEIAETSVTTALYHTQLLKSKLVDTMIAEDPRHEGLEALLHSQSAILGSNKVNIFDQSGKVTFSSSPANIGKTVVLTGGKPERFTPDDALIEFTNLGKAGELRIVHPIRGGAQCMACHSGASGDMLGGVELFVPLAPIYKRFGINRFLLIFAAVAIIFLSALIIRWLVHRIVKRPIKKLRKVMEEAEKGVLDVRTRIHEDPDLRRLAKSFNAMVKGIQKAQYRIENQYQKELAQSNRLASLGQFMSTISHEIRNPLAAISSTMHALRDEFQTADGQIIYRELNTQLERIERTVNNLLRYAKQAPPQFEPCDILDSVQQALQLADHRFRESRIDVKIEYSRDGRMVEADAGQLEQVFLNLFLNAVDAMPDGGYLRIRIKSANENAGSGFKSCAPRYVRDCEKPVTPAPFGQAPVGRSVERHRAVGAAEAGGYELDSRLRGNDKDESAISTQRGIKVEVQDSGPGIASDDIQKIFEPFYSTKKNGTGLGLSVAKGIVKSHNGTVHAESAVGMGTTIHLFFPFHHYGNRPEVETGTKRPAMLEETVV